MKSATVKRSTSTAISGIPTLVGPSVLILFLQCLGIEFMKKYFGNDTLVGVASSNSKVGGGYVMYERMNVLHKKTSLIILFDMINQIHRHSSMKMP